MSNIPITPGSGVSSVATETIAGNDYQQVKIVDGTAASTNKWKINADGSAQVSILGIPAITFSGSPSISGAVTVIGNPSISGQVGASVIGSVPVSVMGGMIGISGVPNIQGKDAPTASITGNPVYIAGKDANGSVAGVQVIGGAVLTVGSVSGSVGIVGTPSVSGTVNIGNTITINSPSVYGNVSGSVVGFQGGAWTTSVVGTVGATQSGAWTTSVVGTITASVQGNVNIASVIGAVSPYAQSNAFTSGVSSVMYTTSSVLILAAPTAPNKNYVTHILATNDGASDTVINIVDNGNVIYAGYAAKSGGGFSATFPAPLKQPTSVLALYAQSTTASSVLVSMSGYTAT